MIFGVDTGHVTGIYFVPTVCLEMLQIRLVAGLSHNVYVLFRPLTGMLYRRLHGCRPLLLGRAPLASRSSTDESDEAEPPSRWEGPLLSPDLGTGGSRLWAAGSIISCNSLSLEGLGKVSSLVGSFWPSPLSSASCPMSKLSSPSSEPHSLSSSGATPRELLGGSLGSVDKRKAPL